jgi:hypothetical protein
MKILSVKEIDASDVPPSHESNYYRMFLDVMKNQRTYVIRGATNQFKIALHTSRRIFRVKSKVSISYSGVGGMVVVAPKKRLVYAQA